MGKLADVLGEGDGDIMDLRSGIAGLVFEQWSDKDIAALAVEIAGEQRTGLEEAIAAARKGQEPLSK